MSYQFDFNGRVFLEPISINKVNKYYTQQHEFLREPAVMATRSKRGELLYLVTFAFDAQDPAAMEMLADTVAMCRAFPYAFIRCPAMEDPAIVIGKESIGDGYFMYAIHEYEIEANSDDQGVYIFSMRLQPINWRALTREIHFLSIDQIRDNAAGENKYEMRYHSNPGDSNVLDKMVKYYQVDKDKVIRDLTIKSSSKGHVFTIGTPVISTTTEQAEQVAFKVGNDRIFRISHPVSAEGTSDDEDGIKSGRASASEINHDAANTAEESSRVIVSYSGQTLGRDKSSSIISLVIRRRNRFANQSIVDFVLPFAQYLGKSPSEVLLSIASNHDDVTQVSNFLVHSSRIVEAMNAFVDTVKSSYPFLTGIDAFRLENPLTKLMAVDYAILDGSQVSAVSDTNNTSICNYTFIESNQSSLLERSKYNLVSSDKEDSIAQRIQPLSDMITVIKREAANGNSPPELRALQDELLKLHPFVMKQIESDSNIAFSKRSLGDLSRSQNFLKADKLSQVEAALLYVAQNYAVPKDGMSPSEWRIANERIRHLTSGINNAYYNAIAKNGANKYVQEIVVREVMNEQERINKYGDEIILSGEAAPDLFIKEIFKDIPNIDGFESWRVLSTIPFVYDKPEIDPAKLRAMWNQEKDKISEQYKNLEGYLAGAYGANSDIPKYNGETLGSISDYDAKLEGGQNRGASEVGSVAAEAVKTNAPIPHSSTGWLNWRQVVPGMVKTGDFGKVRPDSKGGRRFHKGMDIAGAGCRGKPIHAIADGVATWRVNGGGPNVGYGYYVTIEHTGSNAGFTTIYAHLLPQNVIGNSKQVKSGDVIGYLGNSGRSKSRNGGDGSHLHLEIKHKGVHLDPYRFSRNDVSTWYKLGPLTGIGTISTARYSPGTIVPPSQVSANHRARELQNSANERAQHVADKAMMGAAQLSNPAKETPNGRRTVSAAAARSGDKADINPNVKTEAEIANDNRNAHTGFLLFQQITKRYEGLILTAKWDENAFRVGYGSDTITRADGTIKRVVKGDTITKADADRDFARRTRIFYDSARRSIGPAAFDRLSPETQAVLGSIAYNYGSINSKSHSALIAAARSGDKERIASAVAALGSHNGGKNRNRRNDEANLIRKGANSRQKGLFSGADKSSGEQTLDELAAYKSGEYQKFEMNPVPWDETLQAESRIANLGKDFSIGVQKLIPTYKIYLVYGNDDNSLYHLLNANLRPKFYELPSVRNIRVEMANQENPVSVAYFEVMNSMQTAVNPQEINQNAPSHKLDVSSLGSDFSDINTYDQIRLKAGNKIQIRMGYGSDPQSLDVVFNGIITESTNTDVVRVVAEGYGRELENEILFGIDTSILGAIGDNKFVSFKVGQVLKNANLQHFGRTSKLFGDNSGMSGHTHEDQAGMNKWGLDYRAGLWDSRNDTYFMIDFMGDSDTIENYWLSSIDTIDAHILSPSSGVMSRAADLLFFSRDDFIRDFKITNKTVWQTIETGRRLFPSSISLVKDMGARCTTFVGIKEQMMYKFNVNNKLLQGVANNFGNDIKTQTLGQALNAPHIESKTKAGDAALRVVLPPSMSILNSGLNQRLTRVDGEDMVQEAIEANATQTAQLTTMIKDYYTAPPNAWKPATNFHIFSSSYNIISNQLKLNGDITTGVHVEYGDVDPSRFGAGELDTFQLKANGNLHPGFVSDKLYSDTTISTLALAQRTASGYLLEELEKAYSGAIIITGNATVAPGDYALLADSQRAMVGVIKCREVQHVFTEQDGYITIITPGMMVEPATHLYSTLYFKLGLFTAMVAQALETARIYYSAYSSASISFNSVVMSKEIYSEYAPAAMAAVNTTAAAYFTYYAYRNGGKILPGGNALARGFPGRVVRSSTFRAMQSGAMGQWAQKGVGYAARSIQTISQVGSRVVAGGRAAGGFLASTPPGIVLTVIGTLALGMLGNIWDRYSSSVKLQHRALLKFPLMVNAKEYQPGLRGWNDTRGILEVHADNFNRTMKNLGLIINAGQASSEDGINWRLAGKLLSD